MLLADVTFIVHWGPMECDSSPVGSVRLHITGDITELGLQNTEAAPQLQPLDGTDKWFLHTKIRKGTSLDYSYIIVHDTTNCIIFKSQERNIYIDDDQEVYIDDGQLTKDGLSLQLINSHLLYISLGENSIKERFVKNLNFIMMFNIILGQIVWIYFLHLKIFHI